MKTIEISTGVFSKIWSLRQDGEESENDILERLLLRRRSVTALQNVEERKAAKASDKKILWRDDIVSALHRLGGEADLAEIYRVVIDIRRSGGRSLPESTEAVIRRELENNSSASESFTGHRNLFYSANGIGSGRWGLR